MSEDSCDVTVAGIHHRHPNWTDDHVHRELLRLLLGPAVATAVANPRRRAHEGAPMHRSSLLGAIRHLE